MKGYIVVKQFLKGDWVNLISLETLEDINQEQIDEALGTMKDLIFDADKVNISNETSVVTVSYTHLTLPTTPYV